MACIADQVEFATIATPDSAAGAHAVSANLDEIKKMPGVKDAFVIGALGNPVVFDLGGAPAALSGVAIVANSTWSAMQAKKALTVQWDESGASSDSWTGAVAEAKALAAKPPQQVLGEGGNVETAFAAGKTVDAFYTSEIGIKDVDFRGNGSVSKYEVPKEVIDYALKHSPFAS